MPQDYQDYQDALAEQEAEAAEASAKTYPHSESAAKPAVGPELPPPPDDADEQ